MKKLDNRATEQVSGGRISDMRDSPDRDLLFWFCGRFNKQVK